jgi:hypothetical protein
VSPLWQACLVMGIVGGVSGLILRPTGGEMRRSRAHHDPVVAAMRWMDRGFATVLLTGSVLALAAGLIGAVAALLA